MSEIKLPFSLQTKKVVQTEQSVSMTKEEAVTILSEWINRALDAKFAPEDVHFYFNGKTVAVDGVMLRKICRTEE